LKKLGFFGAQGPSFQKSGTVQQFSRNFPENHVNAGMIGV